MLHGALVAPLGVVSSRLILLSTLSFDRYLGYGRHKEVTEGIWCYSKSISHAPNQTS